MGIREFWREEREWRWSIFIITKIKNNSKQNKPQWATQKKEYTNV